MNACPECTEDCTEVMNRINTMLHNTTMSPEEVRDNLVKTYRLKSSKATECIEKALLMMD
jgi:predicted DNA-binding helix-hairpin-helix protein